jgi:hypothetical protein
MHTRGRKCISIFLNKRLQPGSALINDLYLYAYFEPSAGKNDAEKMSDREFIRTCLSEIFARNGFDDIDHLTQRDYEHISAEIASRTSILISVSTLRRLMHGDFARLPQTATLNAIASYLGHSNWQEYKFAVRARQNTEPPAVRPVLEETAPATVGSEKKKLRTIGVPFFGAALLAMVLLISYTMISNNRPNYDKAEFSVRKTTGDDIPNTVVFTYNVDAVKADSFFIQQSWDRNRRVRVFKNTYTLTDIYYEPGYHTAKLIANDSIIRTMGVSIPTSQWFFYSKRDFFDSIPQYIQSVGVPGDGTLSLTRNDLQRSGVDVTGEKYFFYSYVPNNTDVSADDYSFKTRVKVEEVRDNLCPFVVPEVFCQHGAMYFKTTPTGCASESLLQFGEHFLHGKTSDLSAIGADVTEWIDIELINKDKRVTLYYNGSEVFSHTYKNTAGKITGLGFVSNGICKVDFVELKGANGEVAYEDDFDEGVLTNERLP